MLILEASALENPKFKSLYRQLTLRFHPDNKKTGDNKLMAELNDAASKGDMVFKMFLDKLADKGILQKTGSSTQNKNEDIREKMDRLAKEAKEKDIGVKKQLSVILIKKYLERYIPALEKIEGVEIDIYYLDKYLNNIKFVVTKKGGILSKTNTSKFFIENIVDKVINEDDLIDYTKIRALFGHKVRQFVDAINYSKIRSKFDDRDR